MAASSPASLARLVRLPNLGLAAAGVAIGGVLAFGREVPQSPLAWAMLSAIGLGAAGNAANDILDLEADRINRPDRPLPSGALSLGSARAVGGVAGGLGLAAAWWIGPLVFALGLGALLLMVVYSPLLKQRGLLGNLTVAVVASLPLVYGAAAVGWWQAGVVPALLAALLHLAREIVKDVEDVEGDRALGRRTLPLVHGADAGFIAAAATLVLFVPAAVAPWFAGLYGPRYGYTVLALDVAVLVLVSRLLGRRLEGASISLKTAMAVGLFALLWDRL